MFFYGYIMQGNGIHSCIITEGYQMNLCDFYDKIILQNTESIDLNITIANQVMKMINNLVKLQLICGDIKPQNCVINYEKNLLHQINKVDVRMIDLDGDYCKEYDGLLLKKETDISQNKHVYFILTIIMANHFYYYLHP